MADHQDQHGTSVSHSHPGAATYIKLAVILGIITLIEVALYYITLNDTLMITMLLILSAIKFALVVAYYMHLKFDSRLLSGVFLWGLFIAGSVIITMMVLTYAA